MSIKLIQIKTPVKRKRRKLLTNKSKVPTGDDVELIDKNLPIFLNNS